MQEAIALAVSVFVAVLMVVDPFAAVPIFLTMTEGDSTERRRRTAFKAAATVLLTLLIFGAAGGVIFRVFGITLGAFRCAGGLLLLLMAIDMMRAHPSPTKTSETEVAEGVEKPEVGIVPLGIPMLAGPGAIATVTVLAIDARTSVLKAATLLGSIVATAAIVYFVLGGAARLARVLKTTGLNVMNRVMGLILAAVAIQFVADGVRDLFPREAVTAPAVQAPRGPP